jgi:DNA repair exonuclease SbcCD ATPase subunit
VGAVVVAVMGAGIVARLAEAGTGAEEMASVAEEMAETAEGVAADAETAVAQLRQKLAELQAELQVRCRWIHSVHGSGSGATPPVCRGVRTPQPDSGAAPALRRGAATPSHSGLGAGCLVPTPGWAGHTRGLQASRQRLSEAEQAEQLRLRLRAEAEAKAQREVEQAAQLRVRAEAQREAEQAEQLRVRAEAQKEAEQAEQLRVRAEAEGRQEAQHRAEMEAQQEEAARAVEAAAAEVEAAQRLADAEAAVAEEEAAAAEVELAAAMAAVAEEEAAAAAAAEDEAAALAAQEVYEEWRATWTLVYDTDGEGTASDALDKAAVEQMLFEGILSEVGPLSLLVIACLTCTSMSVGAPTARPQLHAEHHTHARRTPRSGAKAWRTGPRCPRLPSGSSCNSRLRRRSRLPRRNGLGRSNEGHESLLRRRNKLRSHSGGKAPELLCV